MMLTNKNALFAAIVASTLAVGTAANAQESAPWLNMGAEINFDASAAKSKDYEGTLRTEAILNFEMLLHEGVKAVIKTRIQEELMKDGVKPVSNSQSIDKFLEEAYITIETDKVSGLPRAVITMGKGEMAFGQGYSELPIPRDSQLYYLAREREVMGITVTLPTNYLKIADFVAVSLYEAGTGDLKISDNKGISALATKQITSQLEAQVSALVKENSGNAPNEKRGSLGVLFSDSNGKYKVWAEGLWFEHNPTMAQSRNFGGQVGASYNAGPGSIVVEYSQVENSGKETTVAYNWPVGKAMVISPLVKYTKSDVTNASDTVYGVRASLYLSNNQKRALQKSK
ncbi:MAG: hypothetical protein IPM57_02055 [Oligoflexia bacterium]|nr:hypothetical protein [Oligoflexia bacterium]